MSRADDKANFCKHFNQRKVAHGPITLNVCFDCERVLPKKLKSIKSTEERKFISWLEVMFEYNSMPVDLINFDSEWANGKFRATVCAGMTNPGNSNRYGIKKIGSRSPNLKPPKKGK